MELLTTAELEAVDKISEAYRAVSFLMGTEASRAGDVAELVFHIHALQNMVLAQAAARAYPRRFRLLGKLLGG